MASAAVMAAGVTSTGGIAALALKIFVPKKGESKMTQTEHPQVVSETEWLAARKRLLVTEKEFSRLRDALSAERRKMPWVKVDTEYVFDGPGGKQTLADLFQGRSQLIVYHFMFGPGWSEGCPSCSFLADHFDGANHHLPQRDVTLVAISRAPFDQIEAFKKRMGWRFKWVSSFGSNFNRDFHVSFNPEDRDQGKVEYNYQPTEFPSDEAPGLSVFYKDQAGQIFHSYSTYARGLDILLGVYNFLDFVPKGRDEEGLKFSMAWVRHHDKYANGAPVDPNQTYVQPKMADAECCAGETR
jgi:predicted dithiol-disulfide oxidoreductase (DUF899 family)